MGTRESACPSKRTAARCSSLGSVELDDRDVGEMGLTARCAASPSRASLPATLVAHEVTTVDPGRRCSLNHITGSPHPR